ncbi:hypothetical protein Y032_0009g710 [Ancylostoma ceylanicum]|uniref:Uncharacterized protein n=1 Tax=Ancylostoma ceylanicum TaxID=53326 RepID=A0A016VJ05_9BILA|nr:hypothetical protein Y032_0009g710 [Ancylostoma ceylanicum]
MKRHGNPEHPRTRLHEIRSPIKSGAGRAPLVLSISAFPISNGSLYCLHLHPPPCLCSSPSRPAQRSWGTYLM